MAAVPGVEARAGKFPGPSLIPTLTAIQREHGWLPREELVALARDERRPLYEIEGLISFYPHFRTEPPEGSEVAVCHDLSCWLARAGADLPRRRDRSARSRASGAATRRRSPSSTSTTPRFAAARARRPNDPYEAGGERYRVLRRALDGDLEREDVIAVLKDSELRGMGGAGFPTGPSGSWSRGQEATPKYAVCNADESEPGTFKDRQILAEQPHLVLEGMLLGHAR